MECGALKTLFSHTREDKEKLFHCIDNREEHADRQIAVQGGVASIGEVQGEGRLQGAAGRYFWQHLGGDLKDRWLQALHLQMNINIGGNLVLKAEYLWGVLSKRPETLRQQIEHSWQHQSVHILHQFELQSTECTSHGLDHQQTLSQNGANAVGFKQPTCHPQTQPLCMCIVMAVIPQISCPRL